MTEDIYQEYAHNCLHELMDKQELFNSKFDLSGFEKWNYHDVTGIFKFTKENEVFHFRYINVGTFSTNTNTWMWSWYNETTHLPLRKAAKKIKNFGKRHGLKKFTTGAISSTEEEAWQFTAIAAKIFKGQFGYRMPIKHLMSFIIILDYIPIEKAQKIEDKFMRCDERYRKNRVYLQTYQ
jgi:hypothetical protein